MAPLWRGEISLKFGGEGGGADGERGEKNPISFEARDVFHTLNRIYKLWGGMVGEQKEAERMSVTDGRVDNVKRIFH